MNINTIHGIQHTVKDRMFCPNCSTKLCFCEGCKQITDSLTENKDKELFICKGCKFTRPLAWWSALELDINTVLEWSKVEENEEEVPEELTGYCESPWGGLNEFV